MIILWQLINLQINLHSPLCICYSWWQVKVSLCVKLQTYVSHESRVEFAVQCNIFACSYESSRTCGWLTVGGSECLPFHSALPFMMMLVWKFWCTHKLLQWQSISTLSMSESPRWPIRIAPTTHLLRWLRFLFLHVSLYTCLMFISGFPSTTTFTFVTFDYCSLETYTKWPVWVAAWPVWLVLLW